MSDRHPHHDHLQGKIVHEYDGILEADNQLPRWWLGIFFGGIVVGFGYWFVYESWGILPSQSEIYAAEVAAAAESGGIAVDDDLLDTLAQNGEYVARGQTMFETNCAACHGARGEGVIGPNLTDVNWMHGGAPLDIYRTIKDGYQERGMPPWGAALGERGVQSVTAFVLTLRDTNVPGRAAEGEPWVPGAAAETAETEAAETEAAETETAETEAAETEAAETEAAETETAETETAETQAAETAQLGEGAETEAAETEAAETAQLGEGAETEAAEIQAGELGEGGEP